mgnify:CR=1 FL=1
MMVFPAAFSLTLLPPTCLRTASTCFPVENIPGGVSAADGGQRPLALALALAPQPPEGPST